jgi:hypothetical protein
MRKIFSVQIVALILRRAVRPVSKDVFPILSRKAMPLAPGLPRRLRLLAMTSYIASDQRLLAGLAPF